jgi:hypothetical protein
VGPRVRGCLGPGSGLAAQVWVVSLAHLIKVEINRVFFYIFSLVSLYFCVVWSDMDIGGYIPLDYLASSANEISSSPKITQSTGECYPSFDRVSRKTLRPACLNFFDEDVIGVCTKLLVAVKIDFQPSDLASLGLVYSSFPKVRKIARWI